MLRLLPCLLLLAAPGLAPAAGPDAPAASGGAVGLDRLLKLPSSYDHAAVETKGGATRGEWRSRFESARASLERAEAAVEKAQAELARAFGKTDAWSVSPPGVPEGATSEAPDAHRLRTELRRERTEVERAKVRLRELEVQANLAGVPPEWRVASTEANPGDDSVPAAARAGAPR